MAEGHQTTGLEKETNPLEVENAYRQGLLFRYIRPFSGEKAFNYFKFAADQGHILACLELAKMYELGLATPISQSQAFNYFKIAADLENKNAIDEVIWRLLLGIGVELDKQEGIYYLQKNLYQIDLDTSAFQILKSLADTGNGRFQLAMAKAYADGYSCEKSLGCAFAYFLIATYSLESAWGQLAECYSKGLGTAKNQRSAEDCMRKGVQAGDLLALVLLGVRNLRRLSEFDGELLLQVAVDLGYGLAECELGKHYLRKGKLSEGFFLLHSACDKEVVRAYGVLAKCYFEGLGTLKSNDLAFKYFKKGADGGDRNSQFYTAFCYGEGLGVEKSLDSAKLYFLINPLSIVEELKMWSFSEETFISPYVNFKYLIQRADNGNVLAQWRLTQIYEKGLETIVEKSLKKAFDYWQLLAEEGHAGAQLEVGNRLVEGLGCNPEEARGLYYYVLAARQGCKDVLPYFENLVKISKNKQIRNKASFLYNFYCSEWGKN